MKNAKTELLEHIKDRKVVHVSVMYAPHFDKPGKEIKGALDDVIDMLDFCYDDNSRLRKELYGLIWYDDGTWSERADFDGWHFWDHKERPDYDAVVWSDSNSTQHESF